jgi:hypothetical protein
LVGAAAIAIVVMLASPVRRPPTLASIHAGATQIDETARPISAASRPVTGPGSPIGSTPPRTGRGTGSRSLRTALRPAQLK